MAGYISEVRFEGGASTDFIEIVVPRGTDVSGYSVAVYDNTGTLQGTFSLGTLDATYAKADGYVLDSTSPGWVDIRDNSAIALVDGSGTVLQFLGFKQVVTATGGPAAGMSSDTTGDISGGNQSVQTSNGGQTYSATAPNPGTIPCFIPGTLIATPGGPRPVETLAPGDLVTTPEGARAIRWTRCRDLDLAGARPDQRPVLIRAGALGHGPDRDLVVSPQHRVLVGTALLPEVEAAGALVPAKALTGLPGIRHMAGRRRVRYVHFAFDAHAVVRSNGIWTESLLLGATVLWGLGPAERRALRALFPGADDPRWLNGPPAAPILPVEKARAALAAARRARAA